METPDQTKIDANNLTDRQGSRSSLGKRILLLVARGMKRTLQAFLFILLMALVVIGARFFTSKGFSGFPLLPNSWVYKQKQTGPVIGDLGGLPVSIPRPFAHFVEYMDDPHFMMPRNGPPPKRTYQSRLRSFGFEVRFPDMAPLTAETRQEKKNSTIYNTMWIDVGVKVAPYHDEKSMERILDGTLEYTWGNGQYGYKQLKEPLYGLVVYEVYGYDDAKRDRIPGNGASDANIYYHIDEQGNIENYIECANIRHDAVSCTHLFTLKGVEKTQVSILYRKALLPQWRQIQTAVEKLILSFAVAKDTSKP